MSKIYIVTTNWGTHDMTKSFVKDLLELEGIEDIKIVVTNNSPEENHLFSKWKFPNNVKVINAGENLGYAGGINCGLEEALKDKDMEFVLITNNDIKFEKSLFKDFLKENWKNNILSPVILKKDSDIVQNTGGKIYVILGGGINVNKNVPLERLVLKDIDFLSGCMLFLNRRILEDVGLFDPQYLAYCEDVDYCIRAKEKGIGLKVCDNIKIRHFHSASTSGNIGFKKYLLTRNVILLARKHYKFPKKQIFILSSIIRGFFQNIFYLKYFLKGVKEGL